MMAALVETMLELWASLLRDVKARSCKIVRYHVAAAIGEVGLVPGG